MLFFRCAQEIDRWDFNNEGCAFALFSLKVEFAFVLLYDAVAN